MVDGNVETKQGLVTKGFLRKNGTIIRKPFIDNCA